ncbi:hypothetical protein GJAV_G00250780 [Gymnothorax javanicus]|nr:hypothetical protein GJAV_G00250780 [Gymnothorax javanicus]
MHLSSITDVQYPPWVTYCRTFRQKAAIKWTIVRWQVEPRCPNLLSLTLSGCGHVEDHDVEQVLRSCGRLRSLRLENCVRISDSVLRAVVLHGQSLEAVQVDFCRNVTQAGLQAVREGRPGVHLSAERSAGMIPDSEPLEKPPLRRALPKFLLFS